MMGLDLLFDSSDTEVAREGRLMLGGFKITAPRYVVESESINR
jgi:hypothetical protein